MIIIFYKTKSNVFLVLIPLVLIIGFVTVNQITPDSHQSEIKTSGLFSIEKPTVVEFMSPTCMACLASKPTVSAMKEIYRDRVDFIEIDVRDSEFKDKILKYNIRVTPTFVMFNSDGNESFRFSGIAKSRIMQPEIDNIIDYQSQ